MVDRIYKALGLVVSEKIFMLFFFFHCKAMDSEANEPRGEAIFDPRDMISRICKDSHNNGAY